MSKLGCPSILSQYTYDVRDYVQHCATHTMSIHLCLGDQQQIKYFKASLHALAKLGMH